MHMILVEYLEIKGKEVRTVKQLQADLFAGHSFINLPLGGSKVQRLHLASGRLHIQYCCLLAG